MINYTISKYQIEVCAANIQSAIAAQKGGADRVELVDNLYEGGTTPSYALIKIAREKLQIGINVMIRPRGSDFCYDDHEIEIIMEDIKVCKELGVDGVVLGVLKPDGNVNVEQTKQLVELAKPLSVTFHRAFDVTSNPEKALQDIIQTGVDRILTAGQMNTAPEGIDLIEKLVKQANGRVIIMPGSGINKNNVVEFARKTGATEFHLSGKERVESKMIYQKDDIYMGGNRAIPEFEYFVSSSEKIAAVVSALNQL